MSRSQDFCIRMPEECSSISKSTMGKWLIHLIEGIVFVLSLGGLIASLTGKLSQNHVIWFLELWKWCVLGMVIFGGRRIIKWMMVLVVNLVKKMFLFMEVKVYYSYYIYSLGKCIGVALWLGSVLVTWVLLFKSSEAKRFLDLANFVKRSHLDSHIQKYITRSLGTLVIGGFLWVLKTLIVNILSSPFQATRLFDRFRESLIDQYILEAFSSELDESVVVNWINKNHLPCKEDETKLVINRLKNVEPEKISAWTMKDLIKVINSSHPLCTMTKQLEDLAKKEQDMTELFGKVDGVADEIFAKVTGKSAKANDERHRTPWIEKGQLRTFFLKANKASDVNDVVQHIIGTGRRENEKIWKQALKKWLVNVTIERRSLAQSLNDTERAIDELNKLLSVILLLLLFILWLIMLEILTTEAFVAIMSQFVALAFIFGDAVKSVFQGIIFVFVNHPFEIGDSCLINKEEMVVAKINLLSTVFRKKEKDKIMYPNSVLTTLPIKNLDKGNRHQINDSLAIAIGLFKVTTSTVTEPDSSTSTVIEQSQIDSLKDAIGRFLKAKEEEEETWLRSHSFKLKEIEDKKLKIVLTVSYCKPDNIDSDWTIILDRRHSLVEELTKFFAKKREIKCYKIKCSQD